MPERVWLQNPSEIIAVLLPSILVNPAHSADANSGQFSHGSKVISAWGLRAVVFEADVGKHGRPMGSRWEASGKPIGDVTTSSEDKAV